MAERFSQEQIAAMAVAAIAEEIQENISCLRIVSFREVHQSSLKQYITENNIQYKKYEIGDNYS